MNVGKLHGVLHATRTRPHLFAIANAYRSLRVAWSRIKNIIMCDTIVTRAPSSRSRTRAHNGSSRITDDIIITRTRAAYLRSRAYYFARSRSLNAHRDPKPGQEIYIISFRWTGNATLSRSRNICNHRYARKCTRKCLTALLLWRHMAVWYLVYFYEGLQETL